VKQSRGLFINLLENRLFLSGHQNLEKVFGRFSDSFLFDNQQ